jgi:hypothetical protein
MTRFPIIRDSSLSGDCGCGGGIKELHKVPRTLPTRIPDTTEEDILLDENNEPILDEQTAGFIYDDLREE